MIQKNCAQNSTALTLKLYEKSKEIEGLQAVWKSTR